jgi:hypothetical protein
MRNSKIGWIGMGVALVLLCAAPALAGSGSEIAAVKRATAAFHSIDVAMMAGWSEDITGCLESEVEGEGAQGHHYANLALVDGEIDPLRPEILQYEPRENGSLRLVGVEYLSTAEPPPLFGHEFHFIEGAELWALHVWVWRHNPSGMFAEWNPKVSCDFAD